MNEFPKNEDLKIFYQSYYENGKMDGLVQWREQSGRKKVQDLLNIITDIFGGISNVIEIGCGTGVIIDYIKRNNPELKCFGFDLSFSGLNLAQKLSIPEIDYINASGTTLPLKSKSISLGILFDVLEHVPEPRLLLSEAQRICNYIVIELPLEDTKIRKFQGKKKHEWKNVAGHLHFYNLKSGRLLLEENGLRIVNCTYSIRPYGGNIKRWIKLLGKFVLRNNYSKIFGDSFFIALCETAEKRKKSI